MGCGASSPALTVLLFLVPRARHAAHRVRALRVDAHRTTRTGTCSLQAIWASALQGRAPQPSPAIPWAHFGRFPVFPVQAKHIDTNVRQQQAHTPGDQRAREPGGDDVTSTPPSGMRPGDASGRPPVPRQASGRKDRPPGLTQTFQHIADSASPEVVPGARLLPADSPSVQSFTKQILEAQAIMGRDEHQFEALAGVGEGEEGLDETEAETSLATLEEEFNHSLSSAEIRIIGSVKRWQRGNLLGSGSYGRVYMAMNSDSGEIFVVKQVPFNAGGAGGPGMDGGDTVVSEEVAQLEMEIALLGTLSHPNIVKYLGTERNNLTNELSIFLEHMPGGSIAELVAKFGKLDESVIRKYTREVLEGLIYLHDRGIIHRDIKGQNILVDNHGSCKLADFGASRFMQSADSAQNMSFKGTPVFMSPEVSQEISKDIRPTRVRTPTRTYVSSKTTGDSGAAVLEKVRYMERGVHRAADGDWKPPLL